ncbi:MAG: asparagine synthase (glutamine-hydrolyzing), partial [Gammaproteobacteria bacterium]|nr:asparagine synthase (glutamine-hydrolyzing) [Gammaproteobacteria bacterium]
MCGIAGIVNLKDPGSVDGALVERMCDAIAHRGPDDSGFHITDGVGLGHRRLSIIDLAGGMQPMSNEDQSIVVTFNGEIYNYQKLRQELEAAGYRFRTQSDTEVLIHGWQEWGEQCVERLNGMFAYALWDARKQCVFLARDRLGIKPLYFALLPSGALIFASELKALLVHPELPRDLDCRAVEDYMALGYVPEPRTILTAASKLEPGHVLLLNRGRYIGANPRQYWDLPCVPHDEMAGDDELGEELMRLLGVSVRRRMIADVPLGAFLSGGVDSSAVVSTMSELSPSPVLTCSISFTEDSHDESAYAERVSRQYGTDHYSQEVAADDFDLIDGLATVYDEPYADSSAIPTYRVCEIARRKVKVALSGDGADESFAGYRRHRWHCHEESVRRRLPAAFRRSFFGALASVYPKLDWAPSFLRAKTTLNGLSLDPVEAYLESVSRCSTRLRNALYTQKFKDE